MTVPQLPYEDFLRAKIAAAPEIGFDVDLSEIHPLLLEGTGKPHEGAIVRRMVKLGRAACFASFGLGKSVIQLEAVRLTRQRFGGRGLIALPLNVRQEFMRDAAMLGTRVQFIRRIEEAEDPDGIYLTNLETIRDGKLDPSKFSVASIDEAAVLRSFGSKTFSEFLFGPFQKVPRRFVATATPDPNDFIELLGYAQFLGVMDIGHAKTRFFKRDSEKADALTLHEHKKAEFWLWVSSWALFVRRPSDLGYSDEGYELPELDVRWHELPSDHTTAGQDKGGQGLLYKSTARSVTHAAREKRESLPARIAKLVELRAEDPAAHRVIWHDLEAERHAIEKAIPGVTSIYGTQDLEEREAAIAAFSNGEIQELAAKPVIAGSGCNLQRHCAWAIFLGIGFKFNDFIQAVHRLHRFLQTRRVRVDLIYTEAERPIREALEAKWRRHALQAETMSQIIREYGLADATSTTLERALGVKRQEFEGRGFHLVNNDCVLETRAMAAESVDLVLTSIPFSTQYEYTPSYNDFGHTDDAEHFWRQMDYLTPELLRVLRPGRDCVIHVKDRVAPGVMTGVGFQTVVPFHADGIAHFMRHGFAFLGMITIVTDVVRENKSTNRLGWTEQCKDGSRMGAGLPEYLLLFRKAPTDSSNGYADQPVVKDKRVYTRARWQVDAHGFWRSSGNRFVMPEDLSRLTLKAIYRLYRDHSRAHPYDHEHHVACGDALERARAVDPGASARLPTDFMLLPPQSWHPEVWSDVTRMRTLNSTQAVQGREKHLCPMQFDICERVIRQRSMEGELVLDPFSGIGSVPHMAVKLGRRAVGLELNSRYHRDAIAHCEAAADSVATPSLLDLMAVEDEEPADEPLSQETA